MAKETPTAFHPLIANFGTALPTVLRNYPPNSYFIKTTGGTTSLYVMNTAGTAWVNVPLSGTGVTGVSATNPIQATTTGSTVALAWNPTGPIGNNNQQVVGLVPENVSSAPGSTVAGRIYYDTTSNSLKFYSPITAWTRLTTSDYLVAAGASSDPTAVAGQIYFNTTAGGFLKFSNGTGWTTLLTDVAAGTGISVSGTDYSRTVSLTNTGVTAGSYTAANVTINAQGRVTAASNGSTTFLTSVTASAPIFVSGTAPSQNISFAATVSNSGGTTVTQTANSASSNQGGVVHQQGFVTNGVVLDQIMTGTSISPPGINGIIAQGDRGYNPTTRIQYAYNNTVGTSGWYQSNVPGLLGGFPASPPTYMRVYRNDYRCYFTYDGSAWQQDTVPNFSGSFPSSLFTGYTIFRTDYRAEFVYDGSAWQQTSTPTWPSSFPSSPVTGLKVWRSDRNIEYYYNGTFWLSTTAYIYAMPIASGVTIPLTATTTQVIKVPMAHDTYSIYLEYAHFGVAQNLTLTSTDNWDVTLYAVQSNFTIASLLTFNTFTYTSAVTGTRVAGNYYLYAPTPGFSPPTVTPGTSSYVRFRLDCTKNGSSSTTLAIDEGLLHYRLIG